MDVSGFDAASSAREKPVGLTARNALIDAFRLIAAFAVVSIHVGGGLITEISRFAVPFFFLVSGYYLKLDQSPQVIASKAIRRIAPVWVAWMAIYIVAAHVLGFWSSPSIVALIFGGGPAYHLWFLPCLLLSIVMLAFLKEAGWLVVLGVGIAMYFGVVATGTYGLWPSAWGPLNPHYGPANGFIYVAVGALIAQKGPSRRWVIPGVISASFFLANYAEGEFIRLSGIPQPFGVADVRIFTLGYGIAVFWTIASLARTSFAEHPIVVGVGHSGLLALGIYAVHVLVIEMLQVTMIQGLPKPLYLLVVMGCSCLLAFLGAKSPIRRLFV